MRGYIQVYTGGGKGKTTAAIGLAVRAVGAGKKVFFMQFMKGKVYSEHRILDALKPELTLAPTGKPFFIAKEGMLSEQELNEFGDDVVVFEDGNPPPDYVKSMHDALRRGRDAAASGTYDLVVLDEAIVALYFGLLGKSQIKDLLEARSPSTELVLTGRNAPQWLIEAADLVTEMKEIKHYYQAGVEARKGIEN